jgi:glycosyltransferase involved in cell wall biosynthesis
MLGHSLVVCTLNRQEILEQCLWAAIVQTRQPNQVIIVDASDNWEASKAHILSHIAVKLDQAEWIYLKSEQKSLTHQRNLGLERCTSEIVFFLDDDALMYPDCSEQIMRVYEQDQVGLVGGVGAVLADAPPAEILPNQTTNGTDDRADLTETSSFSESVPPESIKTRLGRWVQRFWSSENLFLPYDGHYHTYDISALAKEVSVATEVVLHGCRMTFRATAVREVGGLDEVLIRAAIAEDDDISYRVSRKYALVAATQAKLFHQQTPVARLKRFPNTVVLILNIAVLFLLNATVNPKELIVYRFAIGRLLLEFLRDCAKPQRGFPHTRGVFYAVLQLGKIISMTQEELRFWYPKFQADFLDRK